MNDTTTIERQPSTLPTDSRPVLPSVRRETALTTVQFPKRHSPRLVLLMLILALVAAVTAWYAFRNSRGLPDGLIQANGRIESDVVNVSSKLAGRIVGRVSLRLIDGGTPTVTQSRAAALVRSRSSFIQTADQRKRVSALFFEIRPSTRSR